MERLPFQYQKREYWRFYCPICKNERRTFYWPSPRPRHYRGIAALGLAMAAALWPWMGVRGVILFVPVWALFEFVYRAKARQSMTCPKCGFDPYLFKYDVKLARDKVQRFFEERKPPVPPAT